MKHLCNKGMSLIYVAVILVALIAFAGLAIDIGYMYVVKAQLQNAADAAALAGASLLACQDDCPVAGGIGALTQDDARQSAWKIACENKAARQKVFLITNSSTDCNAPPAATELNNSQDLDDWDWDIVIGNWDTSRPEAQKFRPSEGNPLQPGDKVNAVKARARRTSASSAYGMPEVNIFLGKVLGAIPGLSGWSVMNASASAIAVQEPPQVIPLPTCLPSCDLITPIEYQWGYDKNPKNDNPIYCSEGSIITNPATTPPGQMFYVAPSSQSEPVKLPGLAWTNFTYSLACTNTCNMPNPNEILPYIRGEKRPDDLCGKNICTTNGTMHSVMQAIKDRFDSKKGPVVIPGSASHPAPVTVIGWKVFVPVVSDQFCGVAQQACPGAQGGGANPYTVIGYAAVVVTEVSLTGQIGPGIRLLGLEDLRTVPDLGTFNCKGGTKTLVNRLVTSIGATSECLKCGTPSWPPPLGGGTSARLVK